MNFMRRVCFASGLGLLLMAGPMPTAAFAQSAEDARIRATLLGLQQEFAEPLVEVTPELLGLQEELVAALLLEWHGMQEQTRVGVRTMEDAVSSEQNYYRELETLEVMKARLNSTAISEREILKIRIAVRSDALVSVKEDSALARDRFNVGEVTFTDVAAMRARVLKATIMLEALKRASGQ
jgi:hypothetical protein